MRMIIMLAAAAALAMAIWAAPARAEVGAEEFTVNAFAFSSGEKPTGLAVGENGLILASDDGGQNWEQRPSHTAAHLAAVAFADESAAYAVGGGSLGAGYGSVGVILKTVNGGLTWQAVGPNVTASGGLATGRFWGVAARGSAVVAWCAPGPGVASGMVRSVDGGKKWAALGGRVTALVVAARWLDDDGGYAITADGVGWQWDAGGVKRMAKQAPPGRITAAHIVDGENWVAALEGGGIWTTKDAGRTWVAATGDTTLGCRGFSFYEAAEGWSSSVGPEGPRFTTNGGRTWKRPAELPTGPVRAVCFWDAWNGVAAGPFGTIYQTSDGGGTWKSVRGAPRRAGLIVFEPWGSVGDWPLVSILCGDRGYRTLIWWATGPRDESVIESERKLRDAAEALDGSEAMVLGDYRSARHDGSPGFVWPAALPHGSFVMADTLVLSSWLYAAVRAWQPAVVLSPSEKSEDGEESLVGVAVKDGLLAQKPAGVRRWIADPRNAAGTRPATGAEGEFEIAVNPLAPSENFGMCHAVRAAMAAQLARQWPAPLAEVLGYLRLAGKKAGPAARGLIEDLESGGPETQRAIAATAAYGREQRAEWERETAAFYPMMKAEVERGDFAAAVRRTTEWGGSRANFQLPQTVLMELARRAAVGGDAATAYQAFYAAEEWVPQWGPRTAEALEWLLDRQTAVEWPLVATTSSDEVALGRVRPAGMSGDAVRAATVKMESWIQGGRHGEPPVAMVTLRAAAKEGKNSKKPDESFVVTALATTATTASTGVDWGFSSSQNRNDLLVREETKGLTLEFDAKAAQAAWVTIDMGRTGRTALAEPVTEAEEPRVTKQATAGSPLWVRNAALWTRTEKDGRIALRLDYKALGGRPQRGTVWMVTVRRETVAGGRPEVWTELKNGGCWAVMFD